MVGVDPRRGEAFTKELDAAPQIALASQVPAAGDVLGRDLDAPRDVAVQREERCAEGLVDLRQDVENHALQQPRLRGGGVGGKARLGGDLGHPAEDLELEMVTHPLPAALRR